MQEVIGTNQMGKCPSCKLAFQWVSGIVKLRDAYCPQGGSTDRGDVASTEGGFHRGRSRIAAEGGRAMTFDYEDQDDQDDRTIDYPATAILRDLAALLGAIGLMLLLWVVAASN